MRLYFTDPHDLAEPFGKLQFGANGLEFIERAKGLPPLRVRCVVRQADGSYWVFGIAGKVDSPREFYRARTWDGIHYEQCERTWVSPAARWLTEYEMVHDEKNGRLLAYLWGRGEGGHMLWGYASPDLGRTWAPLAEHYIYRDHDAFGILWDAPRQQLICYNATYQKWGKLYEDNIGRETRRVLHIRTSRDGLHWEPGDDVLFAGPHAPLAEMIVPDEQDPPEIEFYRLKVFAYGDRYVGMMLNYAPSPPAPNPRYPWTKHGPHCYGEWWLSRDGYRWERPFREVFAPGAAPNIVEHEPMNLGGRHLWIIDGGIYGLPEDRLFYVGARANAALTTPPFPMAAKQPLALNAALQFLPHSPQGMFDQAYIMAELLAAGGQVVAGYERERCVIQQMRGATIRLKWGDQDGTALAGETLRLRLYLRDARIYSLATE